MANLAITWCLKNKNVSVILLGAKRGQQLDDVCGAVKFQDKLTPTVMEEIEQVLGNKPKLDPLLYGSYLRFPNARL